MSDLEQVSNDDAVALIMTKYDQRYPHAPALAWSIVAGETRDAIERLKGAGLIVARLVDDRETDDQG